MSIRFPRGLGFCTGAAVDIYGERCFWGVAFCPSLHLRSVTRRKKRTLLVTSY